PRPHRPPTACNTNTAIVPCLVTPYASNAAAVHVSVAPKVVQQPLLEHPCDVAYVPSHAHGYTISQQKLFHPKTIVTKHDPFFGTYHQAEVHHAPVVTGAPSSVHHSRDGRFMQHTFGTVCLLGTLLLKPPFVNRTHPYLKQNKWNSNALQVPL
ncbi:uncharacterized protein LOC8030911, partial [Ixodes scapularis]|uniref:uncharacterized protein LOC8030911 n=1 Tax=Ixodes scapularis TaxID=6945 RepID=UPI001C389698